MMREEGRDEVFARHQRVADMVRAGIGALGLRLFAQEGHRSNTVTAVHSPSPDPDALKKWLTHVRVHYGLVLAGGQGELTGKVFRVGHLGLIEERDAYSMLATIEQGLADHGLLSRVGLAVPAAQAIVRAAAPEAALAGV